MAKLFHKDICNKLKKRKDRLLDICDEMERMNIDFELVTAIEDEENGARGLRDTVWKIIEQGVKEEWDNVLIFEDDCQFIEPKHVVDEAMNKAIEQLPYNWLLFYLSGQVTNGFKERTGSNLLQVDMCFATHSWAISQNGMKEIYNLGLDYPIDNSVVQKIQPLQRSYITYPILTTQRFGYSDIGKAEINWNHFLVTRYNQKLHEL